MAFPNTPILDNFTRADQGPQPSSQWTSNGDGLKVSSNTCVASASAGASDYWNPTQFSVDCEVYCKISTKATILNDYIALFLRGTPAGDFYSPSTWYCVKYKENTVGTDTITIENDSGTALATFDQEVSSGDSIGLSAIGTILTAYYKSGAGAWTVLGTYDISGDATKYLNAGYIGAAIYYTLTDTGLAIDDFGGGSYYKSIGVSSSTSSLGSSANASIPKPATVNDRDLLVAILGGKATTTGTFNPGSAWSTYQLTTATGNDVYSGIFYRTVPSAAALTGTFTFTGTLAQTWAAYVQSLSGVNQTSPIDALSTWANMQNATTATSPSVTTVTPGAFGYVGYVVNIDTETTQNRGLFGTSNADDLNGILNVYSGVFNTAGIATGTTFLSSISANQESQSGVFVFRPATIEIKSATATEAFIKTLTGALSASASGGGTAPPQTSFTASTTKLFESIIPGFTTVSKAKSAIISLAQSIVKITTNTTTATKVSTKTSSLAQSLIKFLVNTTTASKVSIKTSQLAQSLVSIITNTTTASKVSTKTAQLTTAQISILTGQTTGDVGTVIDTKTASSTKQNITVLINSLTASAVNIKTAQTTKAIISIIVNTTTASKVVIKTASTTKQDIRVISNSPDVTVGREKTATTTTTTIQFKVNNTSASASRIKTASPSQAIIRIVLGATTGQIPSAGAVLDVTILLKSQIETTVKKNSRIEKYINGESKIETTLTEESRIEKYINEPSAMETNLTLKSQL